MVSVSTVLLALALGAPPPEADFEVGRAAFLEGLQALDQARPEAAIEAFERSVAIRRSPPALYNLGLAYRTAGRLGAALEAFEAFLDLAAADKGDAASVVHARALADELRAARGQLLVTVDGDPARLALDGRALPAEAGSFGLTVDPGAHTVRAEAADGTVVERRAHLDRGGRVAVHLDLRPPAAPTPAVTAPPPAPSGPSPWLWVGLGVVAAVAGGVAAAVVVTREGEPPPLEGGSTGVVLRGLGGR